MGLNMKPLNEQEILLPVYDRVLIEIFAREERTSGGIILPDDLRDQSSLMECRAKIIAVGPIAFQDLAEDERPKINDIIIIPRHAGIYYQHDGKTEYGLRFIRPEEVVAILGEEGNERVASYRNAGYIG